MYIRKPSVDQPQCKERQPDQGKRYHQVTKELQPMGSTIPGQSQVYQQYGKLFAQ